MKNVKIILDPSLFDDVNLTQEDVDSLFQEITRIVESLPEDSEEMHLEENFVEDMLMQHNHIVLH